MRYLVGTPKGRLTRLEKSFAGLPWREVRESVEVKLLAEDGELYILAQSCARRWWMSICRPPTVGTPVLPRRTDP